jgi:hypothetical protein
LRYPQTAGFAFFCRRNKSGSARIWSVGLGVTPVRAAYARSVTGVGRGPSKARPAAVELMARSVANFIVRYVGIESDARCSRCFVPVRRNYARFAGYLFPCSYNLGPPFNSSVEVAICLSSPTKQPKERQPRDAAHETRNQTSETHPTNGALARFVLQLIRSSFRPHNRLFGGRSTIFAAPLVQLLSHHAGA